jgi:signal transduction histidine kinase
VTTNDDQHKILIVDDVTKNIQLVASFLKQAGYDINFALNGKDALRHIQKERFDLILLDIMMPEMDGLEVCQKIKSRKESRDIPVIFITAKTDVESVSTAFEVGGVDYITKPFNRAELLARVKTHLELQSQRRHLEELNVTKDKFFSIIGHDLKSPLNQLLSLSKIIQNELKTGRGDEVIRMANLLIESARSARLLLENLLEWSRSQTGKISFSPEALDLNEITQEIVELNAQNAVQKSIKIKSFIKPGTLVYADGNMVKTILRNLISNSIKFTNNGGEILLSSEQQNGMVTYSVADNGIGIKDDDIKKLFRIDVNPNKIGESPEKGTGLGLILCKEFIEINGGEIWAESKWREGTTFKFKVPAVDG